MIRTKQPELGEPVWELANLFPNQGTWTEEDYLALDTGRLIEYSNGYLEFPPIPTMSHQDIVSFLHDLLRAFVIKYQLGKVYFAPVPVRLGRHEYREPDVFFISTPRVAEAAGKYPNGADLVMEVVSGSPADRDRDRDLVRKRRDCALAGIPEYWIVDPPEEVIVVLRLKGNEYAEHGRFGAGDLAVSALLPGFAVPVDDVWAAAK